MTLPVVEVTEKTKLPMVPGVIAVIVTALSTAAEGLTLPEAPSALKIAVAVSFALGPGVTEVSSPSILITKSVVGLLITVIRPVACLEGVSEIGRAHSELLSLV